MSWMLKLDIIIGNGLIVIPYFLRFSGENVI
nr:MAG TPA: hypothetical protein [Caudoviricetes sp.]